MPHTDIRAGFHATEWDTLGSASAVQGSRWITVMISRLPGEPVTVLHTDDDGERFGFTGAVVTEPDSYEAYNPWTILRADPGVFPAAHANGRVAPELGDAAQEMLPSLLLVAPGYLGDPVGPAGTRPDAVADCLTAVREHARERGLSTVTVFYTSPGGTEVVAKAVQRLGGSSFDLTARSVLELDWTDWADYHSGPRNRRRANILRELRRLEDAGCEVVRTGVAQRFDEVVESRCGLLRHYGQAADVDGERRRLRSLIDAYREDLVLYAVVREDRLLAQALFVVEGRTMQNVYAGTTEEGRDTPYAHLAATYYAPLRYSTSAEIDRIDYGVGHEGTKKLRGCRQIPLSGHLLPVVGN